MKEPLHTMPRHASRAVYTDRAGVRYAVYHRSAAGSTDWQHPYTPEAMRECPACPDPKEG